MNLVKRIERTGVAAIAVHGRLEVLVKRVHTDGFFLRLLTPSLYLCQDERGEAAAPGPL